MDTKDDRLQPSDEANRLAEPRSAGLITQRETSSPATNTGQATSHTMTDLTEERTVIPSEVVQVGSVLKKRFVLEEMLGRGGMGVVYKAQDMRKVEAMDRDPYIAVKVLSKDFQANPDSFIALQRETKKAQQLAHPNIVTVYDFDRDGPNVFMTMELLEGEPLDQLIRRLRPGTLPPKEALSIIEQMSRALAYAHSEKIVHSDFKPGNVFLTSKNVVKVVDFGIARAAKSDRIAEDATVFDPGSLGALTPTYASCEMLEYGTPDPRDDVYGLAVVAYELLAGHHPFERKPAVYARDMGLKAKRPKDVSKEIWQAISHGLEFEREKRTINATQFLQEMSGPRAGRDQTRSKWLLSIGLGASLLILLTFAVLLFFGQGMNGQPDIVLEDTSTLDAERREHVQNLLEVAEVHGLVGRYLEPSGSSAYDAYQQVLALHSNNKQAIEGLQNLGDQLVLMVQEQLRSSKRQQAEELIAKGLQKLPNHQGLLDMQKEF
jgi:serine/threonine protein kinase